MGARTWPTRDRRAALLALVVLVVAVWAVCRDGGAAAPARAPLAAVASEVASAGSEPSFEALAPSLDRDKLETVLADYRRAAEYPPGSRPHDEGTAYKLAWNAPGLPTIPELAGDLVIRFGADRAHVIGSETLSTWIEVFPPDAPADRRAVTIAEAWVTTTSGETIGRVAPLAFTDDGSHRYRNSFAPGALPALASRAVAVRLVAFVEVDGRVNQVIRDFTYTPREVVRVRGVTDAIVDGSLVATLDVDVLEEGTVTFEANLLAADGTPLVWVDQGARLSPGRHLVPLTFFGKAVVDGGQRGPYLIQGVHGLFRSLDEDEMPLRWAWDGAHETAAYALAELSPEPWDAPEKREKIATLERLIAEGSAPATPGPARVVVIAADGTSREYVDGQEVAAASP